MGGRAATSLGRSMPMAPQKYGILWGRIAVLSYGGP